MELLLTKTIQTLLLPPGLMILLMVAGTLLMTRFYRTGKIMVLTGIALLILASMPVVADFAITLLQNRPAVAKAELEHPTARAIVILAGGRIRNSPEYGHDIPSSSVLQRLHYGAKLHRDTGLPILLSGGIVFKNSNVSEAQLMQQVLVQDLKTPVRWREDHSKTTWENAVFSKAILEKEGIKRIYLVTQAWHMPRSVMAFEAVGFDVIPAPTAFYAQGGDDPLLLRVLPQASALNTMHNAMHEIIGILWYKLRYIGFGD